MAALRRKALRCNEPVARAWRSLPVFAHHSSTTRMEQTRPASRHGRATAQGAPMQRARSAGMAKPARVRTPMHTRMERTRPASRQSRATAQGAPMQRARGAGMATACPCSHPTSTTRMEKATRPASGHEPRYGARRFDATSPWRGYGDSLPVFAPYKHTRTEPTRPASEA